MKDYYKILGLTKNATHVEIKNQYKKLALENHPDKNNNSKESNEIFKEISEAYKVLSDPMTKLNYDLKLNSLFSKKVNRRSYKIPKQPSASPPKDLPDDKELFDIVFERNGKTTNGEKVFAGLIFFIKKLNRKT